MAAFIAEERIYTNLEQTKCIPADSNRPKRLLVGVGGTVRPGLAALLGLEDGKAPVKGRKAAPDNKERETADDKSGEAAGAEDSPSNPNPDAPAE